MKKNRFIHSVSAVLLIVLFGILLTGCFQLSEEFKHNSDGSGELTIDIAIDKEVLESGGTGGEMNNPFSDWEESESPVKNDPNISSVKTKDYADDKEQHFAVNVAFKDFEKGILSIGKTEKGSDFKFEKLENDHFKFSQMIKPSAGLPSTQETGSSYLTQSLEGKFYSIKLVVPNPIQTDSSAQVDKKTGEILWKFPMEEIMKLEKPKEIWAEYSLTPAS